MKKRLLSALVSVVLLAGMLPAVVSADFIPITSVKIGDLDYPTVGQPFDYYFSLPSVYDCYYTFDNTKYEKGIVWYDLGIDGKWSETEVGFDEVAVKDHVYKAVIFLRNEGSSEMPEFNYTHGRFASEVSVVASVYPENKVISTSGVVESDTKMKAEITFKASEVFNAAHGIAIELDSFPAEGDTPLSHVPTCDLGIDYFTMRAEWFLKDQKYDSVAPLADDYVFKAGESYNLRLILDCGPRGIFSPDALVTVANLFVDSVNADATRLVADISFKVGDDRLTIEGIRDPQYGEAPQTDGFTTNADADVFGTWFYDAGLEYPQPYGGATFVPGQVYYLQISVNPRSGSLSGVTEDKVELNLGKIHSFTTNGDGIVLSIEFAIPPVEYLPGDVDANGTLNAKDVVALMKHLVGKTPSFFFDKAADFNFDGKINAKDVTSLMKYLVSPKG
jgi:hypothetical protein